MKFVIDSSGKFGLTHNIPSVSDGLFIIGADEDVCTCCEEGEEGDLYNLVNCDTGELYAANVSANLYILGDVIKIGSDCYRVIPFVIDYATSTTGVLYQNCYDCENYTGPEPNGYWLFDCYNNKPTPWVINDASKIGKVIWARNRCLYVTANQQRGVQLTGTEYEDCAACEDDHGSEIDHDTYKMLNCNDGSESDWCVEEAYSWYVMVYEGECWEQGYYDTVCTEIIQPETEDDSCALCGVRRCPDTIILTFNVGEEIYEDIDCMVDTWTSQEIRFGEAPKPTDQETFILERIPGTAVWEGAGPSFTVDVIRFDERCDTGGALCDSPQLETLFRLTFDGATWLFEMEASNSFEYTDSDDICWDIGDSPNYITVSAEGGYKSGIQTTPATNTEYINCEEGGIVFPPLFPPQFYSKNGGAYYWKDRADYGEYRTIYNLLYVWWESYFCGYYRAGAWGAGGPSRNWFDVEMQDIPESPP